MYQERRNNRDEKFSHLVPPSFFFIHFLVNLKTHKEIPTISPLKDDDDSNFYFNERTNNSHEANGTKIQILRSTFLVMIVSQKSIGDRFFPLLDPLWRCLWLFEMLRGTTRRVSGHVRPNARLLARGSGSIHVFKGHYKSDKPDGVIPREEAEVRHYAMETSISGGIVATIRFSLSIPPTHSVGTRGGRNTREKYSRGIAWKKCAVSCRGWKRYERVTGCFTHTIRCGDRFECVSPRL